MRNLLIALAAAVLLVGCCGFIPTGPTYTCPDGTIVSNSSQCPSQMVTCSDGSKAWSKSDCPPPLVKCPGGSRAANLSACPTQELTRNGTYICNEYSNYSPCKEFSQVYCDKFTSTDLSVREAASEAISKHPGPFSVNQVLDVYDWVHNNVFYQNVPVNLTYQPYYPNETLDTGSGDCKNQAVLIASMIEAIGGSARVLLIPGCGHAFPEVYVGNMSEINITADAVWAHYPQASGQEIRWDNSGKKNGEENWFIMDTAGGNFPGQTIEDCYNASQIFMMYDCQNWGGVLNAPSVWGTAYGPKTIINDQEIIRAGGYWYSYYVTPTQIPKEYKWCHYDIDVESLSWPVDWYVVDQTGYYNYKNNMAFRYYCGQEQVQGGICHLDWTTPNKFYILDVNNNDQKSITTQVQVNETCYK